jgi:hypothetical protein
MRMVYKNPEVNEEEEELKAVREPFEGRKCVVLIKRVPKTTSIQCQTIDTEKIEKP